MINKACINNVEFCIESNTEFCNISLFLKNYNKIYSKNVDVEEVFKDNEVLEFVDFMFVDDNYKKNIDSEIWIDNSLMSYLIPNYFFKIKKIENTNKKLVIKHSFESFLNTIGTNKIFDLLILREDINSKMEIGVQKTYIIYDSLKDLYKIGKSNNPEKRIKALSVNGGNLSLVLTNESNIENYLHKKFIHKKISGEWFNLDADDLLELIEKYNFNPKNLIK